VSWRNWHVSDKIDEMAQMWLDQMVLDNMAKLMKRRCAFFHLLYDLVIELLFSFTNRCSVEARVIFIFVKLRSYLRIKNVVLVLQIALNVLLFSLMPDGTPCSGLKKRHDIQHDNKNATVSKMTLDAYAECRSHLPSVWQRKCWCFCAFLNQRRWFDNFFFWLPSHHVDKWYLSVVKMFLDHFLTKN